jgi:hypothetical protein
MKILTPVLAAAALMSAPANAQTNQPWCATDRDGAMNCIYPTLEACEQTVRGEGGACVVNPS